MMVEQGTPIDLIASGGLYERLVESYGNIADGA
jgi:hypothetical protein